MIDLAALAAPFPPDRISWRVGSTTGDKSKGMALAFIDARDVMQRLDEVCGLAGWQCRYPHASTKTVCEIGVKVGEEWVWRADGAGDSDVEKEKGALSDAFKRAAVRFGIGRYLYDVASPWVTLEPAGKSWKIADSEMPRLRAALSRGAPAASPGPGLLGGSQPPPASQIHIPAAEDNEAVWKAFAGNLKKAAFRMLTVSGLEQWQVDNTKQIQAVKVKSAKLHEWLATEMASHYRVLAAKEAA